MKSVEAFAFEFSVVESYIIAVALRVAVTPEFMEKRQAFGENG